LAYTLGEAARATGKSKAAISRAIKNHVLSAEKQSDGSYRIDPSELHRIYPPVGTDQVTHPLTIDAEITGEIRELQAKLEAATQRLRDKDDVIDDLRRRLDAEAEERRKLTALLTDQRSVTRRRKWWPWG
jgi:uncharacterized coiled-coil DUF342 family protein